MTQPIDRETTLQILTDSGCPNGYLASFALHHPQWDWMHLALNAAVAHSRKDAEPVWFHARGKYGDHRFYRPDEAQPLICTPLYTHPTEADKLLQQALVALDNSVDTVREEYTEAVRRYSGLPSRKARLDALNSLLTKHEASIAAIRTYLEIKNA